MDRGGNLRDEALRGAIRIVRFGPNLLRSVLKILQVDGERAGSARQNTRGLPILVGSPLSQPHQAELLG